jgi:predicted dehydrogenase
MTADKLLMDPYAANEHHDGYLRDGCVFREEIDIFDKMAVQVRYASGVQVSYSLTTYSPYEGYRIAFNGTKGRMEAWIHERQPWPMESDDEIRITDMFGATELERVPLAEGGHGGGDVRMQDRIFGVDESADALEQGAGTRDGAFAVLLGVAARRSIDTGQPVKIADLSILKPTRDRTG